MHPTPEQLAALDRWRAVYGRFWKEELRAAWESGDYSIREASLLQQLRNEFGPAWLIAYRPGDTRIGRLQKGSQERFRASRANWTVAGYFLENTYGIVDAAGASLIPDTTTNKYGARCLARQHHITLLEIK